MTAGGSRSDWFALIAGFAIVMTGEFGLILWTTHGHFTYTLDDPYIHLALAENLARSGHYGINIEEYASASSSILWPFLLVPFFAVGLEVYGPLLLNIVFALAALVVIHRILVAAVVPNGGPAPSLLWAGSLLIFFGINGFGIVFTGMEHSLHMLVTASIVYFINRMQQDAGTASASRFAYADHLLVLCIVLSPLVRFEGLAISAFAIVMLLFSGKFRLALVSCFLIVLFLALYFHAMTALGLPWLPSSVLVKSSAAADVASQGDLLSRLHGAYISAMNTVSDNLGMGEGKLLLLIAALIVARAMWLLRATERVSVAYVMGVLAVIALHFAFGKFGWYGRYQCYIFVFAVGAALHLFSGSLVRLRARLRASPRPLLPIACAAPSAVIFTTLGFQQTFFPLITTPIAAQNIYEQQHQMHEFVAHHWKAPVAVNDIGYVAFNNDGYVLDLWGLGSEEARRLRESRDSDMLRKLTTTHRVHLAIIYEEIFPNAIPADWRKLAELRLSTLRITPSYERVSFFVVGLDQAGCSEVSTKLQDFARTLSRPHTLAVDPRACDRVEASQS